MYMYLYQSKTVVYLFDFINSTSETPGKYGGLIILSFVLAIILEGLGYAHFILKNKS